MKPDPLHTKSGFLTWLASVVWSVIALGFDVVGITGILLGALAVGVVFILRAWARPSISTTRVLGYMDDNRERIRCLERKLEEHCGG